MKIAFFHELHQGGARRAVNEFAKQLGNNHEIDLYIVDDSNVNGEQKFYNETFFYKFIPKKWSGKNWKIRIYKDTLELVNLYLLHRKIAKVINEKKYDIVVVFPSKFTQAPFILRFLKLKKIYYCMEPLRLVYDPILTIAKDTDIFHQSYERLNRTLRKLIDRYNVNGSSIFIAPSKYLAKLFSDIYGKKVNVVYCGVDTLYFKSTDSQKRNIDVLFVGSSSYLDGYDQFKKSINSLRYKINVQEVLSDKVWLTDNQLREIYSRSKILVATSYNEPLGLIPLEAMSCGVVVVAVDEGGYKETVVEGQTGFLLSRESMKFSEKIKLLLSDNDLRLKLSKKAREKMVSNWDWKICSKEFEKIITDAIN